MKKKRERWEGGNLEKPSEFRGAKGDVTFAFLWIGECVDDVPERAETAVDHRGLFEGAPLVKQI
jgi:hypothetical protein